MGTLYAQLMDMPAAYPGMAKICSDIVYLMGCRHFEQFCGGIRNIEDPDRFCPFCPTELKRRNREPIETRGVWQLFSNQYPHKDTAAMFLIVPRQHVVHFSEVALFQWQDIGFLYKRCCKRFGIEGGGVMFRFGDPHLHAGTIQHFHINIIKPICGKEYRPPFAKDEREHASDYERMISFRRIVQRRGGQEWLFSESGIRETQPPL